MNLEDVARFINNQPEESKVYIGCDSERVIKDNIRYADYTTVVVIHHAGRKGCKVFGDTIRERDFDTKISRPSLRLMNEVYKVSELYLKLYELVYTEIEIHLDINPNKEHNSSLVVQQAVGYIKGVCMVEPKVKPLAFAATAAADRYKSLAAQEIRMDDIFDFGFTAVDEAELEAVQQATTQATQTAQTADELQGKIDKLYNSIIPLLSNLKKNPEKEYILWPNRLAKVEEFETHLQKIYQE